MYINAPWTLENIAWKFHNPLDVRENNLKSTYRNKGAVFEERK